MTNIDKDEAFEAWANDYGLDFEPLTIASRRYDCVVAFMSGLEFAKQHSGEAVAGNEWIKHEGKKVPLSDDNRVDTILADGSIRFNRRVGDYNWMFNFLPKDLWIVAYRNLINQPTTQESEGE